jgi:peptidyl-prolyl cis-trans isomerase SurA
MRNWVVLIVIIASFILSSCAPEHSKLVLAEFGNNKITLGEFENAYSKNAGGIEAARKDSISKYKNFLDLYTNFRMKLQDAKTKGFDSDQALTAELKDYKDKVGVSYLIEKQIVDPGIKKLYEQRKYELRVSHIMIRDSSDQKAKTLAYAIVDSLKNGKSWDDMAKKYSADQYSKNSGGDIYWITGGVIIPEFEDACFQTEVGKFNPVPVKTAYGWHIVKVTEKRDRIPQIRASHILIDFKVDSAKTDTVAARKKIEDIQRQLKNGADFAEMAKKYSDDEGTKSNNGDLGFFERRMMIKEFDEAAFNLKKGEISDIVKTRFGFHLIKLTDIKPQPTFEEDKENLKKIFKRARYDKTYSAYISKLQEKFNLKINNNLVSFIIKNNDSTKVGSDYWTKTWRVPVKDSVIYSFANKTVSVDSFFSHIEQLPEFNNNLLTEKLMNNAVKKESENSLLAEEANNLEKTDEQFASLMDDYKNGIYIFKLQDDEIWSKIVIDSTRLAKFYDQNKEKYNWGDRVKFQEIYSKKDSLIKAYYSRLEKGESFDSLAAKFTERPGYKEKAGIYELTELTNPLASAASKLEVGKYSEPFKNGSGWAIVKLLVKDPAHPKNFEEAKAEVSGQFQESESKRLDAEYLNKLKTEYKPQINYEKLEEAFKSN